MAHRFTMKDLELRSDDWIVYTILQDRYNLSVTNSYTPFAERLGKIIKDYRERIDNSGGYS